MSPQKLKIKFGYPKYNDANLDVFKSSKKHMFIEDENNNVIFSIPDAIIIDGSIKNTSIVRGMMKDSLVHEMEFGTALREYMINQTSSHLSKKNIKDAHISELFEISEIITV